LMYSEFGGNFATVLVYFVCLWCLKNCFTYEACEADQFAAVHSPN
jgi:hypothetical protein